jgi:hypothetical protein
MSDRDDRHGYRLHASQAEIAEDVKNFWKNVENQQRIRELEEQLKIKQLEEQIARPADVDAGGANASKGGKGLALGTRVAIEAAVFTVYRDSQFPRAPRSLARRVADLASQSGVAAADAPLDPDGRTLREVADAVLSGVQKAEKEDL